MGTGTPDLLGGRYELAELLGAGGTGSVRRARDTVLGREVAVKELQPGQDATMRARLQAEARLAGSLHHPGIAQVYDFGEEPAATPGADPTPYIVMQYVEGTSLSQLLRERGTLPPGQVMGIVAQVAGALQVAHDHGIVHRDLKPGNVIITPAGRAVLVDFGIARTLESEPLTVTGTIVGTVDYISPEQSRGHGASPRSDLYSLGLVAYEALTGRKPFRRENQLATALAHLNDEAPGLGEEIPAGVRELIEDLTRKDPDERPQTAAVVAARATELSADPVVGAAPGPGGRPSVPVVASATGELPRSRPRGSAAGSTLWWRRPSRLLAAGLVALALVVAGVVFVVGSPDATTVPDVRGLPASAAAATLVDAELGVRQEEVDEPGAGQGTVLAQDPGPGTSAGGDTVVVLQVASGQVRLRARSVLGRSYRRAASTLADLGLVPDREEVAREGAEGQVVQVGPVGRLPVGSTVTLTVSVPPDDDDVTGAVGDAPAEETGGADGTTRTSAGSGGGAGGGSGGATGGPGNGNGKAKGWSKGGGPRNGRGR
ncbi:protein kinase domain-containing protein [Nocardioides ferulae]|uniref:protein kinase domain-containing protein n=1 Tax=Nocardioides ferulae TaxID=2340821 RepID=UPI000EAC3E69|nr:protein kinase [Nocardioides ferulae]